jgi:hypothetical protein
MIPETKKTAYERVQLHLFDEAADTPLNQADYNVKLRLQAAFVKKLDQPAISDKVMVAFLMKTFGVSMATAYHDINAVERIIGHVRKNSKDHVRSLVAETLKVVIKIEADRLAEIERYNEHATSAENKMMYSTTSLTKALSVYGKINNLDKEDPNIPNWDDVQPPMIEPTDDVTVLDLEMIPSESIEKLREKYMGKMKQVAAANSIESL